MPSRAVSIIEELYGHELKAPKRKGLGKLLSLVRKPPRGVLQVRPVKNSIDALYRERDKTLLKARLLLIVAGVIVSLLLAVSVYYYNILTRSEQDVYKEMAKIDTLLQRRRNLSVNLARSVRDYAVHEQQIFNHVSRTRASSHNNSEPTPDGNTAKASAAAGVAEAIPTDGAGAASDSIVDDIFSMLEGTPVGEAGFTDKLSGLMAVAENYPDLKLSDNFRKFMDALIETEKDLSEKRMIYSDIVNNYSTSLKTLPGRFFAVLYGFEDLPYFQADSESKSFRPIEY